MGTESDLLAAVLAHPDEDTPRLACADWLDEHGDSARRDRAAFIRLQIGRANSPDAVPSPDEDADHDRLHQLASASWLPPLPAWATNPRFERGFVEDVTCSQDDFIHRADELFAAAPIRRMPFVSTSLQTLARCPHLRRIRAFGLRLTLSPADIRALFESPHLGDVHELSVVWNNEVSEDALKALADLPALASLRTLYLGGELTAGGLAALAKSPHIRGLRSLVISRAGFGLDGMRALAAWPGLRTVTHLQLDGCFNGPDPVEALTASANLGPLARLSLSGSEIEERGAAALGRCDRLRSLRELVLDGCSLDDQGLAALFGGGVFAGVRHLDLRNCSLWEKGAAVLAGTAFDELHTLNLNDTWVRANALTSLAAAPWWRTVQSLDLGGNKFDDAGAVVLAGSRLDSIRHLCLTLNCIDDEGAIVLASAPWLRGLRTLDLSHTDIRDAGAIALANCPAVANLDELRIDSNPFGVAGVRAVLDSPYIPRIAFLMPDMDQLYDDDVKAELRARYGDRVILED